MPASERYGVYDHFAWFYSRGWGVDYHTQFRPVLDEHILPRIPAGARVLDVCCGSGDLTLSLVERGYVVTGLDGSEQMLAHARRRAPQARFLLEDARAFSLAPQFEAALSTFDSLNHVLALEELESVFTNVAGALVAGGLFVFDLNMQEAFTTLWRGSFCSIEDEAAGITFGSYDPEARLGRATVTLFRKKEGDLWRRSDVTVLERCYTAEEVTESLTRAGFGEVDSRDAWELGMRGDIAVGRTFFFAVRAGDGE